MGTPRAETAGPSSSKPSHDQHMSRGQCVSLQTAEKHPLMKVYLRRIMGSFWVPSRNETAQWGARSGTIRRNFVGLEQSLAFQTRIVNYPSISAVKRFIRCITVISRELARPGIIWASLCMPTKEVRQSGYADTHGSESALRRHVLR